MKKHNHLTWRRALRSLSSAAFGAVLLAGLCMGGAGMAYAATPISPVDSTAVAQLKLRYVSDSSDKGITALSSDPDYRPVTLPEVANRETGKAGLCYPTPFNPGVDADGYCWNDDADDNGTNGWAPQGFSVPHNASGDGTWNSRRWEVTSWHDASEVARLRFTDRGSATPTYFDVSLIEVSADGSGYSLGKLTSHADGVVWYGNNLLLAGGRYLRVASLSDLKIAPDNSYVLPIRHTYRTPADASTSCSVSTGGSPCLNGLSFDRSNNALTSNEYLRGAAGARIIRWPFNLSTGLPRADSGATTGDSTAMAARTSPVWGMQGVLYAQGSFFISGACPSSFDVSYREPACVHKGTPGAAPSVLTAVPDMTQNLDWDASTDRIRGVNEVAQSTQPYPQRLVFDFSPTARAITTVRFRNVNSDKCLTPYGSSLNNGAYVVQWDCNGHSGENWYWNGSEIRNFQSDRCLTIYGASTSNGANATQWVCNGSAAQQWTRVTGAAGGGSMLVNGNSGLCLTIYGGSLDNGANSTQWTCGSSNLAHSWVGYTP
ncbi:RICIN domain-containing protein [Streptomyces sp. NBC_00154]|uniref:RICIN domain-containing protein n=1 Tax=Streptomyces sp. NBC_00154 TaxID=2975670 RepID=UPI00225C2F74|nr:RICIN domain-containing protein [Streptomyces sp. NBC_00154]MCX5317551.1 RICIN domain-containing protein [Streptomyces sp. NBC_00154]